MPWNRVVGKLLQIDNTTCLGKYLAGLKLLPAPEVKQCALSL
jgi:hypothetical protein